MENISWGSWLKAVSIYKRDFIYVRRYWVEKCIDTNNNSRICICSGCNKILKLKDTTITLNTFLVNWNRYLGVVYHNEVWECLDGSWLKRSVKRFIEPNGIQRKVQFWVEIPFFKLKLWQNVPLYLKYWIKLSFLLF